MKDSDLLLEEEDPEVAEAIRLEVERQRGSLVMIASENYASRAVLEAQGSILTNKYAEGLPGRRYYGGCQHVDRIEALAIERAKKLFKADWVNVQPHSGSQANMAVYAAVLKPGDTILGMSITHGGHLTHGNNHNFSGRLYRVVSYGVRRETERIDMDEVRRIARAERPRIIVTGHSSYPRALDFKGFREIADEVGAFLMADIAHVAGLVVAGLHPDPLPCAHFVTTTTHKTLRGPRGGMILGKGETGSLIDKSVFPGIQGGPLMHVIAAKAVAFKEALGEGFKRYQRQAVRNAETLADRLADSGFRLVSGGTDNHMLLIHLGESGLDGLTAERALEEAGIIVNRNVVPFETRGVQRTSGLRIGTPAVTTRGMKEGEMEMIGELITVVLKNHEDVLVKESVRKRVGDICAKFPIYPHLEDE